jgi:hypothetical protein
MDLSMGDCFARWKYALFLLYDQDIELLRLIILYNMAFKSLR